MTDAPKVELRFVVWTLKETAHILDSSFKVARTVCGKTPRARGGNRLKKVLFLDSPGTRARCGTCDKYMLAKMDITIAAEPTPRQPRLISS